MRILLANVPHSSIGRCDQQWQRRLALVFMFISGSAVAAETDATSRIDSVVVHPDAAVITRLAEVDLPAGASTVLVRGLPTGIDPASVRVEGSADAPLTILGLDVRTVPGDVQPVIDAPLEAKLKERRDEREALSGRIEALESKKATIGRYATASPEKLSPEAKPLDVSQWTSAWDAIGEALAKVNEELRIQRGRMRDLDAEISALERARPQPTRPGAPKRDIAVALEAGATARGTLQLTYRVAGAGWMPLYDARLSTGTATTKPSLTLVRRASISQRTGEDWSEVQLSVSTVSTSRGTAAPDLPPLLVSFHEMRAIAPLAPRAEAPQALRALEPRPLASAGAGVSRPVEEQGTRIEATGFTVAFSVPGRVSIPTDGSAKTLLISSRVFEPVLAVQTVPALDPAGYLEAAFTLDDEAPLFPGEIVLQRDGALVGRGRLALTAPGDKVTLGFGADDRIKVARVPVSRQESGPSFLNSTKQDTREFKTSIKNLHDRPMHIRVLDQVPYAENTAIQVEMLPQTTSPSEQTVSDRRGVMAWVFDLPPGSEKELRLGYRLRWPADREVVLLPRPLLQPR